MKELKDCPKCKGRGGKSKRKRKDIRVFVKCRQCNGTGKL